MINFSLQKKLHTAQGDSQLNINCELKKGDFISLFGSSGSGKTSILRMLAGLMKPEKGFIRIDDEVWFDEKVRVNIIPQHRKIGFVFQDYALFPNLSVKENITFPLSKGEHKRIVEELLQFTGLSLLADRKIQTLSGGQQQRVALARAIAKKPQLLLLDEPLSAIDDDMRGQLQETLLELHKRYELTTILVSHDISEIIRLSDKIIHLSNNTIRQYDTAIPFLNSLGYSEGLVGNILSVDEDENGSNIVLFIKNSVLQASGINNNSYNLKKGQKIQVVNNKDFNPVIYRL